MRNKGALRRSTHINRYPAVNIHHARRYASAKGEPFNWMVTINFGFSGVASERASAASRRSAPQRRSKSCSPSGSRLGLGARPETTTISSRPMFGRSKPRTGSCRPIYSFTCRFRCHEDSEIGSSSGWKGLSATLFRDAPSTSGQFGLLSERRVTFLKG